MNNEREIKIRKATMEDARRLYEWRNDPDTRANSVHTEEIPWENHLSWLEKTLKDHKRDLYVVEEAGEPCGTIRLDDDGENWFEISWTVAPEFRGKGIGKKMTQKFFDEYLGDKKERVIARVKKENIASIKMIKSLGFVFKQEEGGLEIWRY